MKSFNQLGEIRELLYALRYQYPSGCTTFGPCYTDSCPNMARGSRRCPDCLKKELKKYLPETLVEGYDECLRRMRLVEGLIEDEMDKLED